MPQPLLWQDTYPAKIGGAETLLARSCINCPLGQGKIEFLTSGQLPIPPELSQQIKETKEEAEEALKQAELEKNSVGEAGLLEGAIPIWGSGRDLIHAAQTGDKLGVALNTGLLVWDAASVVAGIFSFGTATVAMAGAKAGARGLLKAGAKVALGLAKKQMAEVATKSLALRLKNNYHAQGLATLIIDPLGGLTQRVYNEFSELELERSPLGQATRYDHNQRGQLREANGMCCKYDAEGNLIRKTLPTGETWHYSWDGAGQLTEVKRPDKYAVIFRYDGLGRCISKRYRGRVTHWVWDGDKPLHEWHELEVGPGASSPGQVLTWLFEEESFAPVAKLTAQQT